VIEKRSYKLGLRHGYWKYYTDTGQIRKAIKYRKGERRMTYLYNAEDRIYETINRKGKVKERSDCNCGK